MCIRDSLDYRRCEIEFNPGSGVRQVCFQRCSATGAASRRRHRSQRATWRRMPRTRASGAELGAGAYEGWRRPRRQKSLNRASKRSVLGDSNEGGE
eukprot:2458630-Alexandrium_andersonii.AAC.1